MLIMSSLNSEDCILSERSHNIFKRREDVCFSENQEELLIFIHHSDLAINDVILKIK